jgi:hypothetical protein
MAVDGVFSHWITDDILAMARPNTGGLRWSFSVDKRRHTHIETERVLLLWITEDILVIVCLIQVG